MALPHTHPAIPGGAATVAVAVDRKCRGDPVAVTRQWGREVAVSPAQRHAGEMHVDLFQGKRYPENCQSRGKFPSWEHLVVELALDGPSRRVRARP